MHHTINIKVNDGQFVAHVVRTANTPAPSIVVLHEIFGVNKDIRETCQELADAGFIAVAPDLFWRQERGVDLNELSDDEWKKGFSLYSAYDRNLGVADIIATMEAARTVQGATGKVGVMGFCFGGLMTFLVAARGKPDAAVAYHGGETDNYLAEVTSIEGPLLMHLAEEDEYIPIEAQHRIQRALASKSNATVHSYPGQQHAFARHKGAHYDATAAALANGRTISFLREHLRPERN